MAGIVTAAQFDDVEGRALVEAIHQRKTKLAQPLPPQTNYRPREWETEKKETR